MTLATVTGSNNPNRSVSVDAYNALINQVNTNTAAIAAASRDGEVSVFEYMTGAQQNAIVAGTSTDDTALIQAALDDVAGTARLRFPKGTYKVNTAPNSMPSPWYGGLLVPSNSHLVFDPGAVIQAIASDDSKYMVLSTYDADNVIIDGAVVVGDRESHTYPNLFDTLAALNAGTYRTKADYSGSFTPTEGMVAYVYQDSTSANNGAYLYSGGAWSKTGALDPLLYVTHEHGHCINIVNSRNVWLNRCRLSSGTGDGLFIGENLAGPNDTLTRGVYVTNCYFDEHRRQGISIVKGCDIAITGCKFIDIGTRINLQDGCNPRSGIDIEAGFVEMSDNVLIANNIFRNCTGGGVINYDGTNVAITGNTFEEYGVNYGSGANSAIVGNTLIMGADIYGNGTPTQTAFTYTQSGTVATCTFVSAHNRQTGDRTYLEFQDANSRVVASGYFAVTVTSTTVLTADIGEVLALASGNGKRLWPANNLTISGNSIANGNINIVGRGVVVTGNSVRNYHSGAAILVGSTAAEVLVHGNSVDVAQIGVSINALATNIRIDGNRLKGCTSNGVSGSATITNNSITDCSRGIQTGATVKAAIANNIISISGYTGAGNSIEMGGTVRHECVGNIILAPASTAIYSTAPALIEGNRITGFTGTIGVDVTGTNANGARVIRNYVETSRSTAGAIGIRVAGSCDGARLIGNTLVSTSSAFTNAIDTSAGANTKITNNVYMATISSAGTDTLTTNVAY